MSGSPSTIRVAGARHCGCVEYTPPRHVSADSIRRVEQRWFRVCGILSRSYPPRDSPDRRSILTVIINHQHSPPRLGRVRQVIWQLIKTARIGGAALLHLAVGPAVWKRKGPAHVRTRWRQSAHLPVVSRPVCGACQCVCKVVRVLKSACVRGLYQACARPCSPISNAMLEGRHNDRVSKRCPGQPVSNETLASHPCRFPGLSCPERMHRIPCV